MTATTEAQEGIKPSDEALRHRDTLVQRARAAGEGQRQRREMFDTFAPTEPTIDDLQRSPAEAGTQDDCEHCATRRKDDESLRRRVRERLARIDQDDIEGGYSVVEMATDLERLARVQLSGLCVRDGCRAGDLPAEAEAQEDSLSELVSDTGLIREVARANVELIDLSEKINAAVERWTAEAKRRKEDLTTAPAEAGTQEGENA